MAHRGIASLAVAAIVSFLLLSSFDPQFSLLHIYESSIYIVLLFLLIYEGEKWAYLLGIIAPAIWVVLVSASNFGGILRQVGRVFHFQRPDFPANLIGAVTMIISISMVGACLYRWNRDRWGFDHVWRALSTILFAVAVYYAVLVFWFSHMVMAGS
jgi:hypothetical protein